MIMEPALVTLLIVALVVVFLVMRSSRTRHRSSQLRQRFGPEYEHALAEYGDSGRAERELSKRARRVDKLEIRALTGEDRAKFSDSWQRVQSQFVDTPVTSVLEANELIKRVMRARGYPVEHFD